MVIAFIRLISHEKARTWPWLGKASTSCTPREHHARGLGRFHQAVKQEQMILTSQLARWVLRCPGTSLKTPGFMPVDVPVDVEAMVAVEVRSRLFCRMFKHKRRFKFRNTHAILSVVQVGRTLPGRRLLLTSTSVDVCMGLAAASLAVNLGTNIFCKGSVDTTIPGVDTIVQNKGRNVKKSPSQVDTSPGQVDTREPSQKACFAVWVMRSTPNDIRSTLETSPRELFCQSGTVCRHTPWAGRHTLESL
ncbi:hypothetical protein Taro_050505 [Colocasia esculenta]|uniref:Uncharacterized protein n=1 Tax=Colocasia esculenta TaxID=4460 RepID=A0A843XE34_COLES|nr:hypothetical protein [Colocasia esculenta]